jgi:2-polyprenyl-3-methyl-5-hydroxy-6-metoxy-1,4-benzoquinol methylase
MSAIVSFLWDKNAEVIERYLQLVPSHVYVHERTAAAPADPRRIPLDALLNAPAREAIAREAQARAEVFGAALAGDALEDLGERLAVVMSLVAALDAAHARTPIELVVLNEDLTLTGRAAVQWAIANAVPSVVVSHSCILGRLYGVHTAVHADEIIVFGERGAQPYRDAKIDPHKIVPMSNPAWDRYRVVVAQKPAVRRAVREQFGWGSDDPLVVFGTTWAAKLSAFCDAEIEARSVDAVFAAVAEARTQVPNLRLLVKGRRPGAEQELLARVAAQHGTDYAYTNGTLEHVVAAADLLLSVDSNLSIEATIAGVPAINVWTPMSWTMGPHFGASDGVVDAGAEHLATAVVTLLREPALARGLVMKATQRLPLLGGVPDGSAALRIAQRLVAKRKVAAERPRFVWEELSSPMKSGVKALDGTYNTNVRRELFPLLAHPPRVVLEIGCASGGTAAALKAEHNAFVVGVERDPQTAAIARTRLDAVVGDVAETEAIRAALGGRTVDTLILADVLEHLYDPWATLVSLRELLAPDAQVIASIPNARNVWLMNELAAGRWSYAYEGLLDVTHIRFFTLAEIGRMFAETGYRVEAVSRTVDERAGHVNLAFDGVQDVRAGSITFHGVSARDLTELTSLQFLVRARVAAA